MSRNTNPSPGPSLGPSAARDALKGTLDAAGDEKTLTLVKKKSWFNSLRDVVQKSALHAKAAVDSLRSGNSGDDGQKQDPQRTPTPGADCDPASYYGPELPSHEHSDESSTPLYRDSRLERHPTGRSKHAIASLRQHLPGHGKRNSISTMPGSRPHSEMDRSMTASPTSERTSKTHKRYSSLGIGSIRGLGKKSTPKSNLPAFKGQEEPEKLEPAGDVPLPSSPIDIPVASAAPALELDLGPSGFQMSPSRFGDTTAASATTHLQCGRPTFEPLRLDDGFNAANNEHTGSPHIAFAGYTPGNLLNVPIYELGDNSTPPTPMPGTNLQLEVDGTTEAASTEHLRDENESDPSEVFERSVTPVTETEKHVLRRMRSLDAMAEACAVAHAADEAVLRRDNREDGILEAENSLEGDNRAEMRTSLQSVSTIDVYPDDMVILTRQTTPPPAPVEHIEDIRSQSSPRSAFTYTAGLGEITQHRFSFDNWLQHSYAGPGSESTKTPPRRSLDTSIDTISSFEDRETPQISPRSTNDGSPAAPSMTSTALEFELKRSERNMRYNAMLQSACSSEAQQNRSGGRQPLRFLLSGSEDAMEGADHSGFRLPAFENAFSGRSPRVDEGKVTERVESEDSVADSLKDAVSDYQQLEERLENDPFPKTEFGGLKSSASTSSPEAINEDGAIMESCDSVTGIHGAENAPSPPKTPASRHRSLGTCDSRVRTPLGKLSGNEI